MAAATKAAGRRRRRDADLDEALIATFPASDPVALGQSTGTEPATRPIDRKAPALDLADIEAAARKTKSRGKRTAVTR